MKKIVSAIMILCMVVLMLAACGKSASGKPSSEQQSSEQQSSSQQPSDEPTSEVPETQMPSTSTESTELPSIEDVPVHTPTVCEHNWSAATCTAPKKCSKCGATDGKALGHKEEIVKGKPLTCTTALTDGKKCSTCGVTLVEQEVINAGGHKDANKDFVCDVCKSKLCKNHKEVIVAGKDATCTTTGLTEGKKCSVCGDILIAQEPISAKGHKANTDDGDPTTAVTCKWCDYVFVEAKQKVKLTLPTIANGTVTADKGLYVVGDTVTLTITPKSGYSQKLYINGKALLLGWKSNTYSFVADKDSYTISGSFEPSLNVVPRDANRWDASNQAHGIMSTYYPNDSDGWFVEINNGYEIITVKAKNYLAGADGNGGEGFAINIGFRMSNGKEYIFRVIRENGKYLYQRFGIAKPEGGNDWTSKRLDANAIAAVCGKGADFKLERTAADTLTLYVNGIVYDSYKMEGVTAATTVQKVLIGHYGNTGAHVDIPFALSNKVVNTGYQFKSSEIGQYRIVYDADNSDYLAVANQLSDQIYAKYNKRLSVASDTSSGASQYEILIGDTNRYDYRAKVMEYSVTVDGGKFRINVGGSYSAEKAIAYLCEQVFTGQELSLYDGDYYQKSLLTASDAITSGTTARVMSANILADSFADGSLKNANYRAEFFAGMLVAYTPDVIGLQETDKYWNAVMDQYLVKIQKAYGIKYERHLATYEGKLNYTSLLYRADKYKVENSGIKTFSWWTNSAFKHNYHMRNITWAQFSLLNNANKKFVVANTHWSYRTEHADGQTYLAGASNPIAVNELRLQCKDETNAFMTQLKNTYGNAPIFLTGDFNTSLPFFTQSGWAPTSYKVISEEAKSNGTSLATVPTSGHYDHLFGTGSYTIKRYNFFNNVNQHKLLTDHPFAYADLAF